MGDFHMGKIILKKFQRVSSFMLAILIFLQTPPFFMWHRTSPLVLVFLSTLILIPNIRIKDNKQLAFFVFLIIFYMYVSFRQNANFFGFLSFILFCFLAIGSERFIQQVFEKYIIIFSLTIIPSIVVFLLVNIFKINFTINYIEPLNVLKSYGYLQYPFFVQPDSVVDLLIPRFCGYYDEPGVIGTSAGVLLLCSKFDLKNKLNIPIFIAGVLSFSFAFYVIALSYGFFFLNRKYKVIFLIVLFVSITFISKNEVLDTYIFSRFQIENGKIAGDNRETSSFEQYFKTFVHTKDVWFGLGGQASMKHNYGGASYKDLIVNYGIVAFIAFVSAFIIYAFLRFRFRKDFFLFLVVLVLVLYQRPFITSYFYVFLIYAPIFYLKLNEKRNNTIG